MIQQTKRGSSTDLKQRYNISRVKKVLTTHLLLTGHRRQTVAAVAGVGSPARGS